MFNHVIGSMTIYRIRLMLQSAKLIQQKCVIRATYPVCKYIYLHFPNSDWFLVYIFRSLDRILISDLPFLGFCDVVTMSSVFATVRFCALCCCIGWPP